MKGFVAGLAQELGAIRKHSVFRVWIVTVLLAIVTIVTFVAFSQKQTAFLNSTGANSLIGKRVELPKFDARGLVIPQSGARTLVSLGCFSCAPESKWDEFFSRVTHRQLIIVTPYRINDLPTGLNKRKDLRIIVDARNKVVPFGFTEFENMCITVDNTGVIRSINAYGSETLDYLRGKL